MQQATCLADLIPHPDQEQRRAIAQALSTSHGDGVCFWFDGWDELPEKIQKQSFIASFIRQDAPQSSLPGCTIAVTSRSEMQFLNGLKMSKVELENLNPSQVEELVVKNTEGTDHNANELLTALESKATLSRFSSLPITVTILIHLFFTFGANIPTTQTELFRCLILNLLLRNLQTRWLLPMKTLENFDSLPEFANKCFQFLCKLAYDGVMQNKAVFRPSDIPNLQLPLPLATLGLMKINPHIEWFGIDEELTFIHSTVQEFLAAYHLSLLTSVQQVCVLDKLVETQHQPVLVFFSGLTKFKGTTDFLPSQKSYMVTIADTFFLTLIECLYEAKTPSLCQIVTRDKPTIKIFDNVRSYTPAHMVPLGYFVAHLCSQKTCTLDLLNCHFSKNAIKSFVETILSECETLDPVYSKFELYISDDHISQSTRSISELIEHTTLLKKLKLFIHLSSFVYGRFEFQLGRHAPRLSIHAVMRPLIGALSKNTSMDHLSMEFRFPFEFDTRTSALIAYSEYYIVLLLTHCPGLVHLDLEEFFQLNKMYLLLSMAISCNNKLKILGLHKNFPLNLFEPSLTPLAVGIGFNRSLKGVSLVGSICNDTLLSMLKIIHKCRSLLTVLVIDIWPSDKVQLLLTYINASRMQSSQKPLLLNITYENEIGQECYQICGGLHLYPLSLSEKNYSGINEYTSDTEDYTSDTEDYTSDTEDNTNDTEDYTSDCTRDTEDYEDNMEPSLFDQ